MESFRGGLYCEQMNLEAILAEGIRGEDPRVRGTSGEAVTEVPVRH